MVDVANVGVSPVGGFASEVVSKLWFADTSVCWHFGQRLASSQRIFRPLLVFPAATETCTTLLLCTASRHLPREGSDTRILRLWKIAFWI